MNKTFVADYRKQYGSAPTVDSVAGYVLDVWWDAPADFRQRYLDMLSRLASIKKPVAILDEFGNFDLPVQWERNPCLQVYRIENRAGERMAQYLIGLGHKKVAYLSLNHDAEWSQDRFAGIKKQFARINNADGVL